LPYGGVRFEAISTCRVQIPSGIDRQPGHSIAFIAIQRDEYSARAVGCPLEDVADPPVIFEPTVTDKYMAVLVDGDAFHNVDERCQRQDLARQALGRSMRFGCRRAASK